MNETENNPMRQPTELFTLKPFPFEKAKALFSSVANHLYSQFPFAEIEHIGSTAISGSLTKGDLDIMVRVQKRDFEYVVCQIAREFAKDPANEATDQYASFKDENTDPELGIQVVVAGGSLDDFRQVKQILKMNKPDLEEYNQLKERLNGKAMALYREGKSKFLESLIAKHRLKVREHAEMSICPGVYD